MKTEWQQLKSIKLTLGDKIYLMAYLSIWIVYGFLGLISSLVVGGLLLILGAFFVYKGKIFMSIYLYIIADLCWVANAYSHQDWNGMVFIIIGLILGLMAQQKMRTGEMDPELKTHKVKA